MPSQLYRESYFCITGRYPAVVALVLIVRMRAVSANAVDTTGDYN